MSSTMYSTDMVVIFGQVSSSTELPVCVIENCLSQRWTTPGPQATPLYEQDIEDGEVLDKTTASALDYSSQEDSGSFLNVDCYADVGYHRN